MGPESDGLKVKGPTSPLASEDLNVFRQEDKRSQQEVEVATVYFGREGNSFQLIGSFKCYSNAPLSEFALREVPRRLSSLPGLFYSFQGL